MKFSYTLLKKLVPAIKSREQLAELLPLRLFEVEGVAGDTLDVKILPNRFSDAASHMGLAREVAAILGDQLAISRLARKEKWIKAAGAFNLSLRVEDKKLCPRYMARYFEVDKIGASPEWMQKVLRDCGLRPISAVVDIMNYAMLEVGQPMHAFDADKVNSLVVRRAAAGEKMTTLDGDNYELSADDLVIADNGHILAIAGVKGGKRAEVLPQTARLIVESANFASEAVYKTSKRLKLVTDASLRFAHTLSPSLAAEGLARATELLAEICGARVGEVIDFYPQKRKPVSLRFSLEEFQKISGLKISASRALGYLKRLGFVVKGDRVMAPANRVDIERPEDLVEEIVRLHGLDKLPAEAPRVAIHPTEHDEIVTLKDLTRKILTSAGYDEAYNYSFVSANDLASWGFPLERTAVLENPASAEMACLRPSLLSRLLKNVTDNFRFNEAVRFFEIGHVFEKSDAGVSEGLRLALISGGGKASPVLELRGAVETFLGRVGLTDFALTPVDQSAGKDWQFLRSEEILKIESDNQTLGFLGTLKNELASNVAAAELDLTKLLALVEGEREYEPIIKYPAIERDISILVAQGVRVGRILELIQSASPRLVYDVDLLDYYENDSKMAADQKSLTFRIVFQAADHTLTDQEANKEMEKIEKALKNEAGATVR